MIHYRRGKSANPFIIIVNFTINLFLCRGSVFPRALAVSVPGSLATSILSIMVYDLNLLPYFRENDAVMSNNAIWAGFSFLVGFLVVFRTSNAYNRFWEGCASAHKMGAEWFDCCAALMAFSRSSTASREKVLEFQNMLIRLFSILHCVALGEIEDCGETHKYTDVEAFKMEIIDGHAIDEDSLRTIRDSDKKVELVFQWIQELIVENIDKKVLTIAPPILTRAFQELAKGMVHFHDALRLTKVPFPYPYAVTCDCLLVIHYCVVPFVVSHWCSQPLWAAIFSFIQIFTLWSLNMIAVEMENPFGSDPNDLDGKQMHRHMNKNFRLLFRNATGRVPTLALKPGEDQSELAHRVMNETPDEVTSLYDMWSHFRDMPLRTYSEKSTKSGSRILGTGASRVFSPSKPETLRGTVPDPAGPSTPSRRIEERHEKPPEPHPPDPARDVREKKEMPKPVVISDAMYLSLPPEEQARCHQTNQAAAPSGERPAQQEGAVAPKGAETLRPSREERRPSAEARDSGSSTQQRLADMTQPKGKASEAPHKVVQQAAAPTNGDNSRPPIIVPNAAVLHAGAPPQPEEPVVSEFHWPEVPPVEFKQI